MNELPSAFAMALYWPFFTLTAVSSTLPGLKLTTFIAVLVTACLIVVSVRTRPSDK